MIKKVYGYQIYPLSNYTNVDMIKRRLFDIPYSTEVSTMHPALES